MLVNWKLNAARYFRVRVMRRLHILASELGLLPGNVISKFAEPALIFVATSVAGVVEPYDMTCISWCYMYSSIGRDGGHVR